MFLSRSFQLLLVVFVAVLHTPATAQSFIEDGGILPVGQAQFEAQSLHTLGDRETGAELLVQWTPIPHLEVRLGTPSYIDTDFGAGFSDPSVGVKTELGSVGVWTVGVLASLTLPVGGDLFGSGTADPELLLAAGRPLGETSLGGHVAIGRDRSAERWFFGSVLGLNHPFAERWAIYLEFDAALPEGEAVAILSHQGVTYGLRDNVQVDAHVGIGITAAAPDVLLGLGLTVQL